MGNLYQKYLTIDDLETRDHFYQPNGNEEIVYNKQLYRWEYLIGGELTGVMKHRASCPFDIDFYHDEEKRKPSLLRSLDGEILGQGQTLDFDSLKIADIWAI